jgi:flagellar basal body-associated protein FliL
MRKSNNNNNNNKNKGVLFIIIIVIVIIILVIIAPHMRSSIPTPFDAFRIEQTPGQHVFS